MNEYDIKEFLKKKNNNVRKKINKNIINAKYIEMLIEIGVRRIK